MTRTLPKLTAKEEKTTETNDNKQTLKKRRSFMSQKKLLNHSSEGSHFISNDHQGLWDTALGETLNRALNAFTLWIEKNHGEMNSKAFESKQNLRSIDSERSSKEWYCVLSMKPSILIDRAARGPRGWDFERQNYTPNERSYSGLEIEYIRDNLEQEDIQEEIKKLNPRTSDVFKLITAKALESGLEDIYTPIELDAREIAKQLGYTPAKNGGIKQKHVFEAAQAIQHIASLVLVIHPDAEVYTPLSTDSTQSTQRKHHLQKTRREKVLQIMATEDIKTQLGETLHLKWEVAIGKWVKFWPRSYAPFFRALIQLPKTKGVNTWTNHIGTELTFYYRIHRSGRVRTQKKKLNIEGLLLRSGLMHEINEMIDQNHHTRVYDYFEQALDKLTEMGVAEGWEYLPEDALQLEAMSNKAGKFDSWLNSHVIILAPTVLLDSLPKMKLPKKKQQSTNLNP